MIETPSLEKSAVLAVVFGLPGPRTRAAVHALQAIARIALRSCDAIEVNSKQDWDAACAAQENVVAISQYPSPEVCATIADSTVPSLIVIDNPLHAVALLDAGQTAGISAVRAVSASASCLAPRLGLDQAEIIRANATGLDAFIVRVGEQNRHEVSAEGLELVEFHVGELSRLDDLSSYRSNIAPPADELTKMLNAVLPRANDPDGIEPEWRVEWPSGLFLLGDFPDTPMNGPVDLTGPARCILYGPYMHLPAGRWKACITVALAGCTGLRSFSVEVVCGDVIAKGRFFCRGSGTFETCLNFTHSRPHMPLEVRLFLDAGEIFGSLTRFDIDLRSWTRGTAQSLGGDVEFSPGQFPKRLMFAKR